MHQFKYRVVEFMNGYLVQWALTKPFPTFTELPKVFGQSFYENKSDAIHKCKQLIEEEKNKIGKIIYP